MITPLFPQFVLGGIIHRKRVSKDNVYVKVMRNSDKSLKERYDAYTKYLPDMPNDVLKLCLEKYTKDLKRIIDGAPPVKKTMYVYRGTNIDIFKGQPGTVYTMKGFSSTSFDVGHSLGYSTHGFIRIKLRPGTRTILAAPVNQWNNKGEYEIILNKGSKFYISKRNVKRKIFNGRLYGNGQTKFITDVTVYM